MSETETNLRNELAGLSPYYYLVFLAFDKNKGQFKAIWNWAAFFFGVFWYLYRGMYPKALIAFIGCMIVGSSIPDLAMVINIGGCIYFGMVGNHDYYKFKTTGKQPWTGN